MTPRPEGAGARVGVLGGTFDPPHHGHLFAAVEVRHQLQLDRVLLVVANVPWQKVGERAITPAEHRLAMVEAAVAGVEGLEASSIEIERGGDSYTVETLEQLHALDPVAELFLIVGADAAAGLLTWHRAEDLPSLATLVLVDRDGLPCAPPPAGWPFVRVAVPRLDISSTDLRERFARGRPVEFLVPRAVATCVAERGIYGGSP